MQAPVVHRLYRACFGGFTTSAAELLVALTADTAGHVGPCEGCPYHRAVGGLDRGATLTALLWEKHLKLLLLHLGNVLFPIAQDKTTTA